MFTRSYLTDLLLFDSRSISIIPVTQIDSKRYWLLDRDEGILDLFYSEGTVRDTLNYIYEVSEVLQDAIARSLRLYPDKIIVWGNEDSDYVLFIPIPPLKGVSSTSSLSWCYSRDIMSNSLRFGERLGISLTLFLERMQVENHR